MCQYYHVAKHDLSDNYFNIPSHPCQLYNATFFKFWLEMTADRYYIS